MLAVLLSLLISMVAISPAHADIAPPWCGDPVPDAAENLPDGTDPSDPRGSFPHIPYYAIRCTLEDIVASSQGRMSLEVMGQSALGRDLFLVTVNALDTVQQRRDFQAWQQVRKVALTDPVRGQELLQSYGDNVKVRCTSRAPFTATSTKVSMRSSRRSTSSPRRRTGRTPRSTPSLTTLSCCLT